MQLLHSNKDLLNTPKYNQSRSKYTSLDLFTNLKKKNKFENLGPDFVSRLQRPPQKSNCHWSST